MPVISVLNSHNKEYFLSYSCCVRHHSDRNVVLHTLQVQSFSQNPPHFYLLGHPNVLHVILFCWFLAILFELILAPFCSVTDSDLPVEEDKLEKIFSLLDKERIEILLPLSKEQSKPLLCGFWEAHCDCLHKFIEIQRLGSFIFIQTIFKQTPGRLGDITVD